MTSRTGELFPPKPRRPYRWLLAPVDAGPGDGPERGGRDRVRLECMRCGHDDGWHMLTRTELRRGIACPVCNKPVLQT